MPKIKVFKGLVTDADAGDLPGGAASDQTNLITTKYGEISPREGIQPATFSSEKTIRRLEALTERYGTSGIFIAAVSLEVRRSSN